MAKQEQDAENALRTAEDDKAHADTFLAVVTAARAEKRRKARPEPPPSRGPARTKAMLTLGADFALGASSSFARSVRFKLFAICALVALVALNVLNVLGAHVTLGVALGALGAQVALDTHWVGATWVGAQVTLAALGALGERGALGALSVLGVLGAHVTLGSDVALGASSSFARKQVALAAHWVGAQVGLVAQVAHWVGALGALVTRGALGSFGALSALSVLGAHVTLGVALGALDVGAHWVGPHWVVLSSGALVVVVPLGALGAHLSPWAGSRLLSSRACSRCWPFFGCSARRGVGVVWRLRLF
jgi:hypothetical protein